MKQGMKEGQKLADVALPPNQQTPEVRMSLILDKLRRTLQDVPADKKKAWPLLERAIEGDDNALMQVFKEVRFVDHILELELRELLGGEVKEPTPEEREEFRSICARACPQETVVKHLRQIRGAESGPTEEHVLTAIGAIDATMVTELAGALAEIASESPYQSVRNAAEKKLASLGY